MKKQKPCSKMPAASTFPVNNLYPLPIIGRMQIARRPGLRRAGLRREADQTGVWNPGDDETAYELEPLCLE
jgi:hypothetical protein